MPLILNLSSDMSNHISEVPAQVVYHPDMAGRPPSKEAPSFGSNLSAFRKARGYNQQQLADLLGVSLDMLTYYERRAKNPSADIVTKAATVLGVSSDELLGHKVSAKRKPGPPSQLQALVERLAALPKAKQKLVTQMLEGVLQNGS